MTPPEQESELRRIRDELRQESSGIQVQGRALSEEERARVDAIEQALPLLDRAIAILEGEGGETALVPQEETPGATAERAAKS